MSSLSKPAALIALGQRAEAKQVILNAAEQAEGHRVRTAEILKMRPSTLYRLIAELEMWSELDALIASRGWAQRAGRARGPLGAIVMLLAVVLTGACEADASSPAEVPTTLDQPAAAGMPAPAPVEQPVAEPEQPVEVAGAAAPAPVEQPVEPPVEPPAPAGAPAPMPAGGAPSTPSSAGAGAPAPMPAAGAPAPQAGSGGSGGSSAPAMEAPTKCKRADGLILGCDDFSRRYWPSLALSWIADGHSRMCPQPGEVTPPQCVRGGKCTITHLDNGGSTEQGVCQ